MNPFHKRSFSLQLKDFFNNGELTTSKADYCYKTTMIALGKKIISYTEQKPASVQLHYRNDRVNNFSHRKVILQRDKVRGKHANESSELKVRQIHLRGKEENNQKYHPYRSQKCTEGKGEE